MRRHLNVEDWYINYAFSCVVPKKGDFCYGVQTGSFRNGQHIEVRYNPTKDNNACGPRS